MLNSSVDTLIEPTENLMVFFKERIENAMQKHGIDTQQDTLWYLTRLLCNYSRTSAFLDNNGTSATLTPLAEYYRQSVEASTAHERRLLLQRLGDVAMVVSGLFAGALRRKAVGVNYYMSMGEAAYSTLADETTHSSRERALQGIFESLASDFSHYVVALSDVPLRANEPQDLLSLVNQWHAEKHPAVARELRTRGVILLDDGASTVTKSVH